jgi:hypothetical protein
MTSVMMLRIACHRPHLLRQELVFGFVGLHGTAIMSIMANVYAKIMKADK